MDQFIKKNFTLNLRYRNNNKGFIIDFMSLIVDKENYPFINIYYFKDSSSLHKHYIINIEGNLEIAHDNYKDKWNDNSASLLLDNRSSDYFYINKPIYNDLCKKIYKNTMALVMYYRGYSDIEKYLYLIRHALLPYVLNNNIEKPISTLVSLLRYTDNYSIPVSDVKKDKTLIKK